MSGSFISELKRRNVLRMAVAYAAVSWLLIQVAETVLPLYGFEDSAARIVVTVLVIGFVPVVVLAWMFEWTSEGIRKDDDAPQRSQGDSRWLDRIIVATLIIAVSYFAVDKFVLDPVRDEAIIEEAKEEGRAEALLESFGDKSIAVLPFENLSSDPEQEFFARGIAEELLNLLAGVNRLRVISRTSSFELKDQGLEIAEIAERLNVAHVLEGSVRRSGNRIRITAQLIDAHADTHIWSDSWDRELDDVFEIQDEIAAEVVSHLKLLLLGNMPRAYRTDPEAYELALKAKQFGVMGRTKDLYRAATLLEQALEIDPDYVPALLELNYATWQIKNWGEEDREAMARRERETFARIVELAPEDPRVLARRAWELFEIHHDWAGAARLFEKSVSLGPGFSDSIRWAGAYARLIGQYDTAVRLSRRAISIDPLCAECVYNLSQSYFWAHRYDDALTALQAYRDLSEGSGGLWSLGLIHLWRGDFDAASTIFAEHHDETFSLAGRVLVLDALGRHDEAQATLAELLARDDMSGQVQTIDIVYARLGDADKAFEWLERRHGPDYKYFILDVNRPQYENLHDDPRWHALTRRVGMSVEQLAAIEYNPQLPQ